MEIIFALCSETFLICNNPFFFSMKQDTSLEETEKYLKQKISNMSARNYGNVN